MADPNQNSERAEKYFLNELRLQLERVIDLRKNVDSKTNNMITISGSIATLNIAIGTFLISRIQDYNLFYFGSILILGVGIILSVVGMWKFLSSYNLRDYHYPIGYDFFFKKDIYQKQRVEQVRNLPENEFNDRVFKGYLDSIKNDKEINLIKSNKLRKGQKYLVSSVLATGIQVAYILIMIGLGYIRLV